MSVPYLEGVIGFTAGIYLLYTYLDVRQLKAIKKPKPPGALIDKVDEATYAQMQAYQVDKWWFGQAYGLVDMLTNIAMLWYGALPWLWKLSGAALTLAGLSGEDREIPQAIMLVLLSSAISIVTEAPWSLYSTFVIEERHGFNKQTIGLWIGDQLKSIALGLVFVPPIVGGLTMIMRISGPYVALYLWAFTFGLSIFMMTIYPVAIAPLFNKFEPLPEGSLKSAIEKLAGSISFPLKKLFVMDGSKRSGHSNAYMYGFWNNKRIVLYDTLCTQCDEDQVVAVLAHELGHWKLRHTPVLFLVGQIVTLAQFGLFTLVRNSDDLFSSFGFTGSKPLFVSFLLFNYISGPLDKIIGYLSNVISRRFEFQADAFAVSLGHSAKLTEALLSLEKENKSVLNVDEWYSAFHYSHPPLVERMRAIDLRSIDLDNKKAD